MLGNNLNLIRFLWNFRKRFKLNVITNYSIFSKSFVIRKLNKNRLQFNSKFNIHIDRRSHPITNELRFCQNYLPQIKTNRNHLFFLYK